MNNLLNRIALGVSLGWLLASAGCGGGSSSGPTVSCSGTGCVSSLADDGSPGTLRAAITAANSAPGTTVTIGVAGTITLASALPPITSGMTIHGAGPGVTTIDGGSAHQPFVVNAPGALVSFTGVSVRHGNDGGANGGAIKVSAGNVNITNCTLSNNNATGTGGAIWYGGTGQITVTNSTFTANGAAFGGDCIKLASGTLTLSQSSMTGNNSANSGGALFLDASTTSVITNCTFSNNTAANNGGSINTDGTTSLTGCTISGSSASNGGGLYATSTVTLTNCTITGNTASEDGGGVYVNISCTLLNCTISGNTRGGLYAYYSGTSLTNCIVYGDTVYELNGAGAPVASPQYCDIQGGFTGTGNINSNPLLGALASNGGMTQTMALGSGSPCLGSGTATGAPTTDQRGVTRPNPPSMGAYD